MTEENVTIGIIKQLTQSGWEIVCFDFPQSGTGIALHPSNTTDKTRRSVIPDIVAVKDGICLYLEDKDKFVLSDLQKVSKVKHSPDYHEAWARLLADYPVSQMVYGVGMPYTDSNMEKAQDNIELVDIAVFIKENGEIRAIGPLAQIIGT